MKIKLFLLLAIFLSTPAMAQQGSITLYDNLCKSCHQNKEELFTKNTINKNNFNKTIFKMFTTYSNYKPTTAQLENMKSLAKATANKKLYIETTNINGNISGETNDFIAITPNKKSARKYNNSKNPNNI